MRNFRLKPKSGLFRRSDTESTPNTKTHDSSGSISMDFEEKILESLEHEGIYFEEWVEREITLGEEYFMDEVFGDDIKLKA